MKIKTTERETSLLSSEKKQAKKQCPKTERKKRRTGHLSKLCIKKRFLSMRRMQQREKAIMLDSKKGRSSRAPRKAEAAEEKNRTGERDLSHTTKEMIKAGPIRGRLRGSFRVSSEKRKIWQRKGGKVFREGKSRRSKERVSLRITRKRSHGNNIGWKRKVWLRHGYGVFRAWGIEKKWGISAKKRGKEVGHRQTSTHKVETGETRQCFSSRPKQKGGRTI